MKLIKRKATLLLTTAAALVSIFWITALTAEDIAQTAPTEALNAPATAVTATSITKTISAKSPIVKPI